MTDLKKILDSASDFPYCENFTYGGMIRENDRLMPIIRALVEVIELQREALDKAKSLTFQWVIARNTAECIHTYEDIRVNCTQALAATDKRLKELAGE